MKRERPCGAIDPAAGSNPVTNEILGERFPAGGLVVSRCLRVSSLRCRRLPLGRPYAAGTREPGQLVARSRRLSVLPCVPDDLASITCVRFNAVGFENGALPDLECGWHLCRRHSPCRDTFCLAQGRDQRVAASYDNRPGPRSTNRVCDISLPASAVSAARPGVRDWTRCGVSCQRRSVSRRLCCGAG